VDEAGRSGEDPGSIRALTLTLMLTDIEGSTRLWETQPSRMHEALDRHDGLIMRAVADEGGQVIQTKAEGDSTFSVFESASAAVAAAAWLQRALVEEPWPTDAPIRVRIAVHTGRVEVRRGDYFGVEISRCARLRASAHGGQTLISGSTEAAVRSALPPGITLKDLGRHRLKDLDRPEHIFQLCHPSLREDFPPLASVASMRHNLPVEPSPLIGRGDELRLVKAMLAEHRMVTLTGAGGCGKTRLGLQVAIELVDSFDEGAWRVELATLSEEALVPEAVARALSLREQVGRTLETTLVEHLTQRSMLIVLDNCEHLVPACAALARTLLARCPGVRILATSRQPLAVPGEAVWRVPSLGVPPSDAPASLSEMRRHGSVALFVERATRHIPTFELTAANVENVAEISRRLDGIPLALELAAARVNVLTPAQILERLDDRFRLLTVPTATLARHRTLRTAVDWSYDSLPAEERLVFERLSVFVGGCTIEAAEDVCSGDPIDHAGVLDHLAGLLDKSLVSADVREGTARYHMLETMREYAAEKLESSGGRAAARERLLDWCVLFVEAAEPELTGPDQVLWYDRIEAEHPNIRAVLTTRPARDPSRERVVRLCGGLWRYWLERGHLREGREAIDRALIDPAGVSPAARAKALRAAGALAMWQSDLSAARRYHEESVDMSRSIGDALGEAASLSHLGIVAWRSGDASSAKRLLEESLAIRRKLGDRPGESASLGNLGLVAQSEGHFDTARAYLEESLAIDRELGDKLGVAGSLSYLGELARAEGDLRRAEELHREGLAQQRDLPQREVLPMALEGMAGLAGARGRFDRAARLFGTAETLRRSMGLPLPPSAEQGYERDAEATRAALGAEPFERLALEGREMTLEAAISYALAAED
jgi:predicted ATPase/class 3 adenylate cyclase